MERDAKPFVITISNLFYCKQVELNQDEFQLINIAIVYIKHMNAFLYQGQFIIVPDLDGHGPKIRICLDESGFNLDITSSSDGKAMVTSKILGTLVVYAVILHVLAIS